ncbi:hypothetical protein BDGGKGIB_04301 [Nodularia sphaerocarpa UHCC 0038]|nr:hypothetical protein BDGGKGIB_04301 [Nodularia sphaerocarpa UHCC 0038]
MYLFFDILKISSVIETLNSHWTNNRDKQAFSLVHGWLHLRLVMYFYRNKFRQTQSQQGQKIFLLDKKQYKTPFQITVISLLRLVNSNLEILLIRKKLIENDAIKWLPAFHR